MDDRTAEEPDLPGRPTKDLDPSASVSMSTARETMPGWVPRAIFLFMVGIATLFILRWLMVELQSFLLILVSSLFLSFALEPAVNWLANHGLRRGLATGLVMLGGFAAAVAFLVVLGSALFTQVSEFANDFPARVERIETQINDRFDAEVEFDSLVDSFEQQDLQGIATRLAENALVLGISAVGVIFTLFTIALFTFYMVADGPRFRRTVLSFLSPERQETVLNGWEIAIQKTGGYIYSRGLLALLSTVATTIVLQVMGIEYAFALGIWTGLISQFIPTIGTYLAGALPVLIALLDNPNDALIVFIFMIVYQQIENYVFAPKITAKTMDLHPAVAFGTVLVGAALFGGVGGLLALPAAAVIQAIGSTYFNRHEVIDRDMTRDARSERRKKDGGGTDVFGSVADPSPE